MRQCLEEAQDDKGYVLRNLPFHKRSDFYTIRLRVLVVGSPHPGAFCAGADLIERKSMTQDQVSKFLTDLRLAFSSLENLSLPTIAAIDGPALGGGLEMALACDLRVAGRNTLLTTNTTYKRHC